MKILPLPSIEYLTPLALVVRCDHCGKLALCSEACRTKEEAAACVAAAAILSASAKPEPIPQ